jgi:7-carboxy-7-deazaguanine synthase
MNIKLSEIFYSFQGESSLVGNPTVFIRFSTCNLRCRICDTKYSFKTGEELSIEAICKIVLRVDCNYVCITGGEPLVQRAGLLSLIRRLKKSGKIISLETNGSFCVTGIPVYVKKIIDVKTPSTGCAGSFCKGILKNMSAGDELKFVISNKADYNFSKNFIIKNRISGIGCKVIFSPNLKIKKMGNRLSDWILADQLGVVFGPQLHKLIKERPVRLI